MPARAYVLIRTQPGLTDAIYQSLLKSSLVRSLEMITGPYDLVAVIEAATTNDILVAVRRDIRPAAGVWDTVTCLVIPTEES